jgi:hypothetical protein
MLRTALAGRRHRCSEGVGVRYGDGPSMKRGESYRKKRRKEGRDAVRLYVMRP